ncbi:MAG: hypothetical protein K2H38_12160 [Muribaculaceae bacterium]|nr:hypothetical protein [Muribaculaceae bacterium]
MATNTNPCQTIVKSMGWCQGRTVKPGIRRRMFLIAADQILKWPTIKRDSLGRVTSSVLQGSFQLVEGAKWAVIEHLPAKAEFKSETQGEYPSQTFKVSGKFVHPGVGEEAADATASLLNCNAVGIVEDMDSRFRVIGSEDYDSVITSQRDNGQGPTGTAGTTVNMEASMEADAFFYEGEIVTEDGTINEAQGA